MFELVSSRFREEGRRIGAARCVYEVLRLKPQTPALLGRSKGDAPTALLLTISAMFDSEAFPEPDRFLANRRLECYLYFVSGMHACSATMIDAFNFRLGLLPSWSCLT